MNERYGTDFFPLPYKTGIQYCFMRKNYKVNLVWNYKARMYGIPYEKNLDGELVACNKKYEVEEFKRLFNAHKIFLLYGDEDIKEKNNFDFDELPY